MLAGVEDTVDLEALDGGGVGVAVLDVRVRHVFACTARAWVCGYGDTGHVTFGGRAREEIGAVHGGLNTEVDVDVGGDGHGKDGARQKWKENG